MPVCVCVSEYVCVCGVCVFVCQCFLCRHGIRNKAVQKASISSDCLSACASRPTCHWASLRTVSRRTDVVRSFKPVTVLVYSSCKLK